ncbi:MULTISPECIES: hypothetical protein [unclassified Paenibacillus]
MDTKWRKFISAGTILYTILIQRVNLDTHLYLFQKPFRFVFQN